MLVNRSRVPSEAPETAYHVAIVPFPYTGPGQTIEPPKVDGSPRELFCSGHTLDEDGNVIFAGGHGGPTSAYDRHGIKDTWLYKWRTGDWQRLPDMANGRWYPTVLQLPDRIFLTMMGEYCEPVTSTTCAIRENRTPDLMTLVPGENSGYLANLEFHRLDVYYPHVFVHPITGEAFFAAAGRPGFDWQAQSAVYNVATQQWTEMAPIRPELGNVRQRYPSAVMMDGVIYRAGGSSTEQSTDAEPVTVRLDLSQPNPQWTRLDDMELGRKNHTLVALPDGRILAMGGNLRGDRGASSERTTPEMLDPQSASPVWRLVSPVPATQPVIGRGYHSNALLLPDARVVFCGGEREFYGLPSWTVQRTAQFYTPQYGSLENWQSLRPTISQAPEFMRYGSPLEVDVETAAGRTVSAFRIVSLGSTTHSFNENQQFVTLAFQPHPFVAGRYIVNPPPSSYIATPGYFMLFAVDSDRVPSVAAIVQLKDLDRSFVREYALLEGAFEKPAAISQTFLPDNDYFGHVIHSGANGDVTLLFTGQTEIVDAMTLRLGAEMRSNAAGVQYRWLLENRTNSSYDVVSAGTCPNKDEFIKEIHFGRNSPYVGADGSIHARLEWHHDNPLISFDICLDRVEFGVGPTTNAPPSLPPLSVVTAHEGVPLALNAAAVDLDVPPQTIEYSLDPNTATGLSISASGLLTWEPGELDGGTQHSVTLRASDGLYEDSRTFLVHVEETNQLPVIDSIGSQTIDEGAPLLFQVTAHDDDVPQQNLSFQFEGAPPDGAALNDQGAFSWTPSEDQGPGNYAVTIRVTDSMGGSANLTVPIIVRESNAAPVLEPIEDTSIAENSELTFLVHATDSDVPPNTLAFSLVAPPQGATISPDGIFRWTPTEMHGPGDYEITAKVTDNGSPPLSDTESFIVHVSEKRFGAVIDLSGTYLEPAGEGSTIVTTGPFVGEQVHEFSGGANAFDGTLTPFSDGVKPPTIFRTHLGGRMFEFVIETSGVWDAQSEFRIGAKGQTSGLSVRISRNAASIVVALGTENGTSLLGPLEFPVSSRSLHVRVEIDTNGAASTTVTLLDGSDRGAQGTLGPLHDAVDGEAHFFAGFVHSGLGGGYGTARIIDVFTDSIDNALSVFARGPFVRPSQPIAYELWMSNMRQRVGGYQAYLSTFGNQTFIDGTYSDSPFSVATGGTAYNPINASLNLSRGMAFGNSARADDAQLAELRFLSALEGTARVRIKADNGAGLETVFADDGTLGNYIYPSRRDSNTVVIDGTVPVLDGVHLLQGDVDVLASQSISTGELRISVDVHDILSGLAELPQATLDFAPFGSNSGEDLVTVLGSSSGNMFQGSMLISNEMCAPARLDVNAVDRAGNVAHYTSNELRVNAPRITLHIHRDPWVGNPGTVIGTEIRVSPLEGGTPIVLDRNVVFDGDGNASLDLTPSEGLPYAEFTAITVKDSLHSLRKRALLQGTDRRHEATLELTSGDLSKDNRVDIADYVVLALRYGTTVDASTPFPHATNFRHADIDGSGEVDIADYAAISAAWFTVGDTDFGSRGLGTPRSKISVFDAMLESGSADAAKLDRDGDGWITLKEVNLRTSRLAMSHPTLLNLRN